MAVLKHSEDCKRHDEELYSSVVRSAAKPMALMNLCGACMSISNLPSTKSEYDKTFKPAARDHVLV
jgi:hypothetical protein